MKKVKCIFLLLFFIVNFIYTPFIFCQNIDALPKISSVNEFNNYILQGNKHALRDIGIFLDDSSDKKDSTIYILKIKFSLQLILQFIEIKLLG